MSKSTSPSDVLRIEIDRRGTDSAVVTLTGSANMDIADHLQERLIDLLDQGAERLVLDLSGLKFISSVGLSAIIGAHLHCRHRLSEVRLVNPQPAILDLLNITRLTRIFTIHDSVEQALSAS